MASVFVAREGDGAASRGVHVTWKNIKYDVRLKNGTTKTLIHDVSGQVPPGRVLALMGASGAGKTTLLNILAGRISGFAGQVAVNGAPLGDNFRRICGYVTQDVPFLEFLTVHETLTYTARLRLPGSMSAAAKRARVDEVIGLLDLHACAHTQVGKASEAGGISGGERRRLALGCELLYDPQLILADEVTSGLDSASAMRIALIMRKLARTRGVTVLTTVHQPRPDVLDCFDQVMLLAGGRVAYYGPSISGGLIGYFAGAGYPFATYANPADSMLDLVNADHDDIQAPGASQSEEEAGAAAGTAAAVSVPALEDGHPEGPRARSSSSSSTTTTTRRAAEGGARSEEVAVAVDPPAASPTASSVASGGGSTGGGRRRQAVIDDLVAKYSASKFAVWAAADPPAFPPPPTPTFGSPNSRYPTSWLAQAQVVCERAFWYKLRNPDAVISQFVASVVMAVIVGTVFLRLPLTGAGVRDRLSAIAFILLTQSFVAFDQVIIMPQERAIMLRDSQAGCYSTSAFYVGRSLAEIPVFSIFAVVVAVITNYMFGLRDDPASVGAYILIIVLVTNVGASLLTLIGALSSSMAMGNGISTLILVFASLFNGFYINPANIHVVYRWIFDISFCAFGVRAALWNELSGLRYSCSAEETASGCTGSGDELLIAFGFANTNVWQLCGYLFLQIVIFRVLAFVALHFLYTGQSFKDRLRAL